LIGLVSSWPSGAAAEPRAAVFSDKLPGFEPALAEAMAAQARGAGYATEYIDATVRRAAVARERVGGVYAGRAGFL
jgi:hypothetical protein